MVRTALAREEATQREELLALVVLAETTQTETTQLAQEEDLEDTAPLDMARKKGGVADQLVGRGVGVPKSQAGGSHLTTSHPPVVSAARFLSFFLACAACFA